MQVLRWLGFAAGLALAATTAASIVVTLVVPRGIRSRLGRPLEVATVRSGTRLSRLARSWAGQDRVLALLGPLMLMVQLLTWVVLLYAAWALTFWPFAGDLPHALLLSGSAMFTLGIASTTDPVPVAITFVAAASGLVVVALQIAYLPTIYAAYNRRETLVSMLETRGGAPVWGPEILARHALVDIQDDLPRFYADWEMWAADVAESHTNYPVLLLFRSPTPSRSWIVALLAVLDAAALHHSLCPDTAPSQVRLVLRMGFTALRDIGRVLEVPFDQDPSPDDPIALSADDFRAAVDRLEEATFPLERSAEEAWPHFRGWRVNYEALAWAIGDRITAPAALWAGPRRDAVPGAEPAPRRPVDRRPGGPLTRDGLAVESARRRAARAAREERGGGRAAR